MLRRINDALPGLVWGIILYGVVIQVVGVWFVQDKISYTIGLWYGIAIAVGIAINLATVIYDTVGFGGDEKHANRMAIAKSLLRYVVVAVLFFVIGFFNFGNLLLAFIGVLGLKISAYMQPLLGKVVRKFRKTDLMELPQ